MTHARIMHDHVVDRGRTMTHGQSHGSSVWARVRHAVSEAVGGHSHDASDQVDDVLEADAAGRRALLISWRGTGADRGDPGGRGGAVRVGGLAGRHAAQFRRRIDRSAFADRVPSRESAADQALHLRLRSGRGSRRVVRDRDDHPVGRAGCLRVDRSIDPSAPGHAPMGRRRRGGRGVHRQRMGRPLPDTGRAPDRQRRTGRRRTACAHRWLHQSRGAVSAPAGSRWAGGRPTRLSG